MHDREVRRRFVVRGTVQGVGFRPFVYGLATTLGLSGWVRNDSTGVVIEVQGAPSAMDAFRRALVADVPALAVVEGVDEEDVEPGGESTFSIRHSETRDGPVAAVSPDVATCSRCLREISDPAARRYGYAFTNCTNCGPRFTITTQMPYDRPNTTMASFGMCASCKAEYEDPADRRFHAQPIACPECGPRLRILDENASELGGDPISLAAHELGAGAIVAVKGIGGYHLACDASNDDAVAQLRSRKAREEKPLAVMVPSLEWACRIATITPADTAVLAARQRPIVLVPGRPDAPIAPSVAPGTPLLGIVLPYTPMHQLLLGRFRAPIVLTSGNVSDEPIAYRDEDAFERLSGIADVFLTHDRPIHIRCDDSVVRIVDGRPYPTRRARGYAPEPLRLSDTFERPVLGAGAELKHTFCLARDDRAFVSHHIGDLENYEAMSAFVEGLEHYERIFGIVPEVVAHDMHPEYLSTKWAMGLEGVDHVPVQHHHAHIAACLADNERRGPVIGLALDGAGYGDDGAIWGCEVLVCDRHGYERTAHLSYVPMPGGSAAIKEPWRMGAVYLSAAFGARAENLALDFVSLTADRWAPLQKMAAAGINAPKTSSAGRLFDAVAALCGLRRRVSFEGQAAAELEAVADPSVELSYPCSVAGGEIDGVELVAAVAEDLVRKRPLPEVAAGFHNGLTRALAETCELARARTGIDTVALSGGTWQNLLLLDRVRSRLARGGFDVMIHRRVPPNDGGISLGQAVVANSKQAVASP